ncbi:hypothetical protein ASD97_24740 [Streptomyces sp. Root63]|uniref:hypothetical protein n=1 Tax=unclassified Streptomyces TaxID=2593676 RepID=UPI0006FE8991|nr:MULTISPECIES: hypothetical protein [unclassified Streptomyces]KQX27512.1 hypothetical protein ASD29_29970 [Streptomyces sp. Root1295]KRA34752.1 hypothetical protein ASD97_24740 [Streptomyces sp. Root63]
MSVEIAVWLKRVAREEERVEQGGSVSSAVSREDWVRQLRITREVLVGHLLDDLRGCRVR